MSERKKIENMMKKKELEVMALEEQLKAAKVYLQAMQDVLKVYPKVAEPLTLRTGSAVALTRDMILKRGEPVHIGAILEGMGKEATRENRASLTSSLAAYVRRGEVFTRPAPNTFGLLELGHTNVEEIPEPPAGFGTIVPSKLRAEPTLEEDDTDIPWEGRT